MSLFHSIIGIGYSLRALAAFVLFIFLWYLVMIHHPLIVPGKVFLNLEQNALRLELYNEREE